MENYVSVTKGETVDKYWCNLVLTYESWLCVCSLIDTFNGKGNTRAIVLVNQHGNTQVVQLVQGSAVNLMGNMESYKKLENAGYRWVYMFDCLLDLNYISGLTSVNRDWVKYLLPGTESNTAWLYLDRSKDIVLDGLKDGKLVPSDNKEFLDSLLACYKNEYDVYDVPGLCAVLNPRYDWSSLDDCIYSLDSANLRNKTMYLYQGIKDNKLIARLYVRRK